MCFTANLPSRTGMRSRGISLFYSLYLRAPKDSSAADSHEKEKTNLFCPKTRAGFEGYRAMKFV
jgi:hypothetical protein